MGVFTALSALFSIFLSFSIPLTVVFAVILRDVTLLFLNFLSPLSPLAAAIHGWISLAVRNFKF